MMNGEHWRRVRRWAGPGLLIVIALAGAAHLWVRTGEYGLGLTNDSLNYLATAEIIADGKGLRSPAGGLLLHPPLYPLVLAGVSRLGVEPVAAAQLVNIAAFGLLTLLAGLWLRRRVRYGVIAGTGALTVMAASPLVNAASYLWTETLFVLLILLSLLQLEAFLQRPGRKLPLAASAICAGLAAVARYMGIAGILTGVLLILAIPKLPARVRLAYAVAYGAAASVPLAVYMARNYAVSGSWIESPNRGVDYTIGDALRDLADGALGYLQIADTVVGGWSGLFWAGVGLTALAATVGVLLYFRLTRAGDAGRDTAAASGTGTGLASALPFAVFAAAYVAILLIAVTYRDTESIDGRLLMPILTPLLLIGALMADRVLRIEARGWLAALKWLAATAALLFWAANLAYEIRSGLGETATALESGYIGDTYNTAQWRDGETPAYLKAHPVAGTAYTNHAGRLWWFADLEQRKITVRAQDGDDCPAWLRRVLTKIERDDTVRRDYAYIIWFDRRGEYRNWCDIEPDKLPPGLERLAVFGDGAVYRVRPLP